MVVDATNMLSGKPVSCRVVTLISQILTYSDITHSRLQNAAYIFILVQKLTLISQFELKLSQVVEKWLQGRMLKLY